LTAQGYPRIDPPQVPNARKMSILGAFSAIWTNHPQIAESK
jgi:hypothetical protein